METLKNTGTSNRRLPTAIFLLRLALAATFLSAVFSRLGLWGSQSSGWDGFLEYTAQVNSFAPAGMIPFLAISATVLETALGMLLLIGYKTRLAAYGAAILTLVFALTMAYSFGVKNPLDYSVFVDSAAAFLLAGMASSGRWSVDSGLNKN
ncbi:DoxX family protein [Sinomicrobium weinanense]|uniref:DoxX family protein n=1 Tax=Sinomicrobium weinanense TaxID=2842200 RepID=A0A926JUX3_9FLAO|nr:DoxX family protein [Sinomicrobium weinanense]MBC9797930.1 DoxX family protein [Sinomicrobium weinanense]MBU3123181.1 DoxX family protein [Sinomicrobium weinanense]